MGKIIAGNWKMNKTNTESVEFVKNFIELVKKEDLVIIFPPATSLKDVSTLLKDKAETGVQNIFYEPKGAFTGEISAEMALNAGASFVLIGHSERRQYFKESNNVLNKKLKTAVKAGLKAVFCVGEKLDDHANVEQVLTKQLSALAGVNLTSVIIAYEPVWAIGTGVNATKADIIKAHQFIRNYVAKSYGAEVKVLYGGSVNPENAKEILGQKVVDGVLVGGASLDVNKFAKLVEISRKIG